MSHPRPWVFAFFILTAVAGAQPLPRFRSETELVYLTVSVHDKKGRPVPQLRADDFLVYEDKVRQSILHFDDHGVPLTTGLVLDRSGSMVDMIEEVFAAALHVVDNMGPRDETFLITFNDRVQLTRGLTHDSHELRHGLEELSAQGETALYDAVYEGLQYMGRSGNRRRVLCVITDGEDNASRHGFPDLLKIAEESDVMIYAVTMGVKTGWMNWSPFGRRSYKQMQKLAEATGGVVHTPRDVEECRRDMKRIAAELRVQYGLGYYPTNRSRDGAWRKIEVRLKSDGGKYVARTRRGYYEPSPHEPPPFRY